MIYMKRLLKSGGGREPEINKYLKGGGPKSPAKNRKKTTEGYTFLGGPYKLQFFKEGLEKNETQGLAIPDPVQGVQVFRAAHAEEVCNS